MAHQMLPTSSINAAGSLKPPSPALSTAHITSQLPLGGLDLCPMSGSHLPAQAPCGDTERERKAHTVLA